MSKAPKSGPVDGQIIKSGYLIKTAGGSLSGWKKRYFVLNGTTLTYFADHNNLQKAKGDVLLTADATLENFAASGKNFCLRITTPFASLVVCMKDEEERQAWRAAVVVAIEKSKASLRGYITKKGAGLEGKTRRFFVLLDNTITYHKDHEHAGELLGSFKIDSNTTMEFSDEFNKINLEDSMSDASLYLRFLAQAEEYQLWKRRLLSIVIKFKDVGRDNAAATSLSADEVVKRGRLKMRPAAGGEAWEEHNFAVTSAAMIALDLEKGTSVVETFHINPSCSVFETNLGRFAFELVTPKKVLHVQSESKESTAGWIKVLRDVIANSSLETNDPLLRAAIEKMKEDVLYTVSFHEDKPLGVVLERSGEWAIVKLANERETGVAIGSALMSVNNDEVMFAKYQETIARLKNWRPPLHLTFLKSPEKRGFLVKESRGRNGNTRNWKRRYFILEQGRIMYKDKDAADAEVKGDIPLMGSAVSLATSQETGKFFCFRLVSGITSLVMQAETFDDLMDWASTMYHAIGIANGGAHILRIEHQKRVRHISAPELSRLDSVLPPINDNDETPPPRAVVAAKPAEVSETVVVPAEVAAAPGPTLEETAKAKADEIVSRFVAESAAEAEKAKTLTAVPEVHVEEPVLPEPVADVEPIAIAEESVLPPAAPTADETAAAKVVAVEEPHVKEPVEAVEDTSRRDEVEASLRVAMEVATYTEFGVLISVIAEAKLQNVDENLLQSAMKLLDNLRSENDLVNEVNFELSEAIHARSIPLILAAINKASKYNIESAKKAEAAELLVELREEEAIRMALEVARLEAEAAALDEQLAAEPETPRKSATVDTDDEDDELDDSMVSEATPAKTLDRQSLSSASKLHSDGRKLASRAERMRRESMTKPVDTFDGPEITDDQIDKLFMSYAKTTLGYPTLNVMQFSTIWRLITGVRGNLFQEMKIFNQFDVLNNGVLCLEDFRKGWRVLFRQPDGADFQSKLLHLVGSSEEGGGNLLL